MSLEQFISAFSALPPPHQQQVLKFIRCLQRPVPRNQARRLTAGINASPDLTDKSYLDFSHD
jgi:hypothetical protein